jgi:DNA processing protein
LKQGATLVTETDDVLTVLGPILGRTLALPAGEPEPDPGEPDFEPAREERQRIVALLGPTPVEIDDLIRLSGARPAVVRTVLLELEIAGRLERQAGGRVALI